MSLLVASHHAATWALVGLIWVIQLVQYPLFAHNGREAFVAYHQRYTRRITWVVAPLMFTEIATAAWIVLIGARDPWLLASLGPLAFNWLSTALVQVPLHNKLSVAFEARTHARLVTTNWWRTAAWSLRGLCLLVSGL
jgi:hypothetical protein